MPLVSGRLVRPVLIVALLAGLAVAGFLYATRAKPVAVQVVAASSGRVEMTVANTRAGSVAACRRARIAPATPGRIARLPVKKGDRVKSGDLLLELWNEDMTARERISREQLATANARVSEACQLAAAALSEAGRARQLRDKGFVSAERVTRAEADAQSRQAGCEATRTATREAQARIAASQADTARTVLRAPFTGIVAEINGEIGEYLTPSPPGIQTLPAIDLIDDSCLYVTAPIDEVDAAQLKIGMMGRITLDAYRGKTFAGHVRRIAPYVLALEKQARTVEVEVEFDHPGDARHLLVGYSADIEVVVDTRDNVVRVPTSALMPGNRVLTLGAGDIIEEHKLDIGLSNWEFTEVKAGLAKDTPVIISLDREGVKPGALGRVEAKAAAAPR